MFLFVLNQCVSVCSGWSRGGLSEQTYPAGGGGVGPSSGETGHGSAEAGGGWEGCWWEREVGSCEQRGLRALWLQRAGGRAAFPSLCGASRGCTAEYHSDHSHNSCVISWHPAFCVFSLCHVRKQWAFHLKRIYQIFTSQHCCVLRKAVDCLSGSDS